MCVCVCVCVCEREREREREVEAAGAAVVLHILHSADVRAGHSSFPYTRSVGKKYGGSEVNGRTRGGGGREGEGPQPGSPVLYFLPGVAGVAVVAAAAAAASFARYACQDIF